MSSWNGPSARKRGGTSCSAGGWSCSSPKAGHADLCWRLRGRLTAAIERAGIPFYSAPMGMTVRLTSDFAFEPDALVAPLPKPRPTDLKNTNPIIVVEALSPSTAKRDWTDKLDGYVRVPSIAHDLIVDAGEHEVTWYRRAANGDMLLHCPCAREA